MAHALSPRSINLALALILWGVTPAGVVGCHTGASTTLERIGGDRVSVQPEDGPPDLVTSIAAASNEIALEMYLLTDPNAVQALVSAQQRGCDVRVILEPAPYRATGANAPAHARLSAVGVDVRWATARFPRTHAKLLIVDRRRLVVTTANMTPAGLTSNREFALVTDDPVDVAEALRLFEADRRGDVAREPEGRLLVTPGHSRAALTALIQDAQAQLEVEMEELSDAAMVQALTLAAARRLAVTVVAPARDRSPATNGALLRLATAGVLVRAVETPTIHAKAIVADGRRLFIGSTNLTPTSLETNREVGILLDDPAAAARVSATILGDATRGTWP